MKQRGHGGLTGLLRMMRGRYRLLAMAVISGVLAQGGTLACMAISGWIVGIAVSGETVLLPWACGWLGVLVLFTAAVRWWQAWVSHDLAFALIEKLQMAIFDGLERSAPDSASGQRLGDLATVATADAELMERFYAHTLADYVGAIVVPLAALIALWQLDPLLAGVLLPFLLLVATVPVWLARRAALQGQQMMHEQGQLNADTAEFIHGQRELAAFGQSAAFMQRLLKRSRRVGSMQQRYGSRSGLEFAAVDALSAAAVLALIAAASTLLHAGSLSPLWLPLVLVLGVGALLPIVDVTQTVSQLGELWAGANRIMRIVDYPARVKDGGSAPPPERHDLAFSAVRFGYAALRPVLQGLSASIQPGEIVALAGRSGAGKSTLVHLLLRFYDVDDGGAITLGGTDIRSMPLTALRQLISWVPQEVYLFNGTVADNIRLGRPDASPQQIEEAAKMAQAHGFISALADGYDSDCGERGSRFSGGQRQRIAIARALLTGAPVLILDEASASLDNENEQAFHRALSQLREKRTVLLIAHRPATLRQADRILLLENGVIAENGTHDALLASGGKYAALIKKVAAD
ncbi:ABC transporter ATP-binding protein [Pantoea coffeiphila]|uniref:ABC transporter ATP-binding protein n=1 Tax=Pantoea coffeiphila TaxID=1465635 RepID=UPI0019606C53|nr:ABC transporter ATP-binding protein [Pantoea coffeiphila]MBM7345297.1 ATP-binding cassette subfamily C protein CydCD [Pantoea coffeiphila]